MSTRLHVKQASWTLIDQGLVSLGAFLVNVQLARQLAPDEFGAFALLLGGLLGLQLFTSSLLLYPMSVSLPVSQGDARERLYAATVLLVGAICVPLCAALATALFILQRADLIPAALALLVCWQLQETMRRGLLAAFRHSSAIYGDTATYFGQVVALFVLSRFGHLTLENALFAMAAAYATGVAMQAVQLRITLRPYAELRATASEFWSIGGWSLANNLLALLRVQILPWVLAAFGGMAAAGAFQAVLNVVNLTNPICWDCVTSFRRRLRRRNGPAATKKPGGRCASTCSSARRRALLITLSSRWCPGCRSPSSTAPPRLTHR